MSANSPQLVTKAGVATDSKPLCLKCFKPGGIEKVSKRTVSAVCFRHFEKFSCCKFCELYICFAVSGWKICVLSVDSYDLSVNFAPGIMSR